MDPRGNRHFTQSACRCGLLVIAALFIINLINCASGQSPSNEIQLIRREMEQIKRDYEQRMRLLEERLKQVEVGAPISVTNPPSLTGGEAASETINVPRLSSAAPTNNAPDTAAGLSPRGFGQREFRRTTESQQRSVLWRRQEAALTERVENVLEDFVEITGYFRAGYGEDDEGGPQVAFQAPGAFAKYRLGNEAEVYGELGFGKNFYLPGLFSMDPQERPASPLTGPIARVQLLISAYNPYEDLLSASGTDFGLPEAWASIGNILPAQPNAKLWAGTRFYRRHDIHINDFYFYNMSGAGGGLEDLELPFGKAAIAWIGAGSRSGFSDIPEPDPENEAGFRKSSLDFRLYDVPLPLGKGEFGVALAHADAGQDAAGNSAPASEGISVTAMHIRDRFISYDGVNKFALQFGTGPAKTFTSGFETFVFGPGIFIRPDSDNSWRFRATEHFTANVTSNFSIGPALIYQLTDYGDAGGMVQWGSAGLRPVIHPNRFLSFAFEGGVDWVHDDDAGTSDYLYKLTFAPQVSLGSRFMSRPVLRLFVTYAQWGDEFVGQIGGADYVNEDHGLIYGIQMEAWW